MTGEASAGVGGDQTFRRVAVVIGVVSTLVFVWFLLLGRADVAQSRGFAQVFDIQARALLDGRLSVPDGSLGFEGFVVDGKTYAYFGIFPALIRLPVFLLTDRLDGRLTAISMLIAYVVAFWALTQILRQGRTLLAPTARWGRPALWLWGTVLAVFGLGSNLFFLSSGAWVYHEASLWGAAAVFASFAAVLRYLHHPRLRSVVIAGVWAVVAWTARGSVGLAPSAVLAVLGLATLIGRRWPIALAPPSPATAELVEPGDGAPLRWRRNVRLGGALLAAAVLGGLLFGAVNAAKFGSPASLPMDKQVASFNPWPERAAALEAYDGSLFSAKLIPSVLAQSLRPDLVEPDGTWPFLRFSGKRPPTPDGLVFDTVEPSAGFTVTSPLLLVLAAVGAVAILRPRRWGVGQAAVDTTDASRAVRPAAPVAILRPFLLGGLAASYAPLTIAFIAQRYLTDALPLVVVAVLAGGLAVERWMTQRAGTRWPHVAMAGFATLAVLGIAVTWAVTWQFQRFVIPPDAAAEAAALRAQVSVSDVVGIPPAIVRHDDLPLTAPEGGQLAVVRDCDGLYRGQGDGGWRALELTPGVGFHRLTVDTNAADADPEALLSVGAEDDQLVVAMVGDGDGGARLVLIRNGERSAPGRLLAPGEHELAIQADPAFAWTTIRADGDEALFVSGRPPADTSASLGTDPDRAAPLPTPTPTCDALTGG